MTSKNTTVIARALTMFAVTVVALVMVLTLGSRLTYATSQRSLESRFEDAAANLNLPPVVDAESGQPIVPKPGEPVALLTIDRIGLREVVVEGTDPRRTKLGPGHLAATPLPGQYGNAVIMGRSLTYGAPFRDIDALRTGDEITVTARNGTVRYNVRAVKTVAASRVDVLATNGKNQLTLLTATNAFDASRRTVVQADLVGKAIGFTPSRVAPTKVDLGVSGKSQSWAPLALALQLLLFCSIGWAFATRRIHTGIAWLIAAPIALAIVWLVSDQFALVLPSVV